MKILALDLGKFKTAAYLHDSQEHDGSHQTLRTAPIPMHDLLVELQPDRVVFDWAIAGWLADLVRSLEIELQVANVAHDAWRWRNVRSKSDRLDAIKLAELSAVGQLPQVHVSLASQRFKDHEQVGHVSEFVITVDIGKRADVHG